MSIREDIKPASKTKARYRQGPKGSEYMARDNRKRAIAKYLWLLRSRMDEKRQKIAELEGML